MSGYIGTELLDEATAVAVTPDGGACIAGYRDPHLRYVTDPTARRDTAAFVAKVAPDGRLEFVRTLDGDGDDIATGVAVDRAGNIYLCGSTRSTETTFPVRNGPRLVHAGGTDGFIAKLDAAGSTLLYCGYIGGTEYDSCAGVAVDSQDRAILVGSTQSNEASFPVLVGPVLTYGGGFDDGFICRVASDGGSLEYCGYVGGEALDGITSVAVDGQGRAVVAGITLSTEASFPVAVGPSLHFGGERDAFCARVNPAGSGLDYCGYIGGASYDVAFGVATDAEGAAYVVGGTLSSETSFPVKVGPSLKRHRGWDDGWIAKVEPGGAGLEYCGYLGGEYDDDAYAVAVSPDGVAAVVGLTLSKPGSFPTLLGPNLRFGERGAVNIDTRSDGFLLRVRPDGSGLLSSGYLGGGGDDHATAVAVTPEGLIYVAGRTNSGGVSFPMRGGPQPYYSGDSFDGFIASVDPRGLLGVGGRAVISRAVLRLGKIPVGKTRSQSVYLSNHGDRPLTVDVPELPAPFLCAPTGRYTIRPGQRLKLVLSYTASEPGLAYYGLAVTTSDPQHPLILVRIETRVT